MMKHLNARVAGTSVVLLSLLNAIVFFYSFASGANSPITVPGSLLFEILILILYVIIVVNSLGKKVGELVADKNSDIFRRRSELLPTLESLTQANLALKEALQVRHQKDSGLTQAIDEFNAHSLQFRYELSNMYNRVDALFSIHGIVELNSPLPIMKDWSISSDFAHRLVRTILAAKDGNVIDIGSGISTILSGYMLKRKGYGKVFSLEHNEVYFQQTRALIQEHKLDEFIDLYHCPLKEFSIEGETWLWYDFSKVRISGNVILITVDGPPGDTQKRARYPAIPLLKDYISDDTSVLLDDGNREDELQIAQDWGRRFNLEYEFIKAHKGIIVLKPTV